MNMRSEGPRGRFLDLGKRGDHCRLIFVYGHVGSGLTRPMGGMYLALSFAVITP